MTNKENNQNLLERILENRFYAEAVEDYDSLKNFLTHPKFPNRAIEFKRELADAILNHKITPELYENLTNHELENQQEVDEFLKNEIWQPLYGNEPVKV